MGRLGNRDATLRVLCAKCGIVRHQSVISLLFCVCLAHFRTGSRSYPFLCQNNTTGGMLSDKNW